MKIDIERCLRAMGNIRVQGIPSTGRNELIEEAIAAIQKDGHEALRSQYLGIKNYAQFGDQRCDCSYGCGPRHGYIVFSVMRNSHDVELGPDEIYLLECVRDFGSFDTGEKRDNWQTETIQANLCGILSRYQESKATYEKFASALEHAEVEPMAEMAEMLRG